MEKDGEFLNTLARGLSVIRVFDKHHPTMTLSQVAAATNLNPAVARRCLHTLEALGYVVRRDKQFMLTPQVMTLSSGFLDSTDLEHNVRPYLQIVRDEVGDSVSYTVLSKGDILYLSHITTNRMVRLAAHIGTRFPAYATSLGKAMLAYLDNNTLNAYLSKTEFEAFTNETITDSSIFSSVLQDVRRLGYATSQDELDYGLVSLAVPIFAPNKVLVGAINCSTSTTRVNREQMVRTRLPSLQRAASQIEQMLVHKPALVTMLSSYMQQAVDMD